MEGLNDFEPLINKLSRENFINSTVGEEDLKQILWEKLINILPYLKDKDREDVFKYVKSSFNREIKCLKYKESRIPGSSIMSLCGLDFKEILYPGSSVMSLCGLDFKEILYIEMTNLEELITSHNQEDELAAKELNTLVYNWCRNKPELIHKFIMERLSPSKEIEEKWVKVRESFGKKYDHDIPIFSLLKILGIPKVKYFLWIRDYLASYLNENGYSLRCCK